MSIQDAAQEAYEAAERAGALDVMVSDRGSPSFKLETFKYVFMVDDEVILHGAKPPSTNPLPIPREKLQELHPVEASSQLNYTTPWNEVAYTNVTISRRDLRRIKRQWPAEAKKFAARFKRNVRQYETFAPQ
jgi:hypothetical protein